MNIALFTTVDAHGARVEAFRKLVRSIEANLAAAPAMQLKLYALLQNATADQAARMANSLPGFVVIQARDGRVSLSAARNMLMREHHAENGFDAGTLVAFPDDDAWYPPNFLSRLLALFESRRDLDFWFCRYGTTPGELSIDSAPLVQTSYPQVIRKSSSNTVFMRGNVVGEAGYFDEYLGLGAPLGGAEDIDFALRVFEKAKLSVCRDEKLVGHRDFMPALRSKYYPSGLFVLARHARAIGMSQFVRKVAIGLYLTLRGELPFRSYAHALRLAFAEMSAAGSRR